MLAEGLWAEVERLGLTRTTTPRLSIDVRHAPCALAPATDGGGSCASGGAAPPAGLAALSGRASAALRTRADADALHAVAIDIGTTTVSLYLVDLLTGQVVARSADYNAQISRGEDVISRIIYASQKAKVANLRQVGNLGEMQHLVVGTINKLVQHVCRRAGIEPQQIYKAVVAGNPTMLHLFLGIPPETIRLAPYIPTVNHTPSLPGGAASLGLEINPRATVDCLPGVASYVGADITAGVLSSGLHEAEALRLFIDVGTNGEMVLGNADWLICCACSVPPVIDEMRIGACRGLWNNRVVRSTAPRSSSGNAWWMKR